MLDVQTLKFLYVKLSGQEPQFFFLMRSILGVRELVTALFREINFAKLPYFWGGINSAVKGGNELPHSTCEFHNSQEMKFYYEVGNENEKHDFEFYFSCRGSFELFRLRNLSCDDL
jgi:hypothetical protein